MGRIKKDTSRVRKKQSACLHDLSIADAENFEPPQKSSTPSKIPSIRSSKRILKDNNSLNISVINKSDKKASISNVIIEKLYDPILPVIEENVKYDRVPELFCSDPEEESIDNKNKTSSVINDSDDKWTTLFDDSENENVTNVTDILAEIDADIQVRFDKAPRRSYPGRKRNNKSLFEKEEEEEEEVEEKITKKTKKPKQKKKINPEEEAFIVSINEHFNDVETFSLIVE